MEHNALDPNTSLEAYPNMRAAAELIGVSASTLSRRSDLVAEHRGERDVVLSPNEVLRLASIHRRRSLNDVAQGLIDQARKVSAEAALRVEEEVEAFFEGRSISDSRRNDFLSLARRLLPATLYKKVEAAMMEEEAALPEALIGHHPLPNS